MHALTSITCGRSRFDPRYSPKGTEFRNKEMKCAQSCE